MRNYRDILFPYGFTAQYSLSLYYVLWPHSMYIQTVMLQTPTKVGTNCRYKNVPQYNLFPVVISTVAPISQYILQNNSILLTSTTFCNEFDLFQAKMLITDLDTIQYNNIVATIRLYLILHLVKVFKAFIGGHSVNYLSFQLRLRDSI